MSVDRSELAEFITATIKREAAEPNSVTRYREPLVGFVSADDPRFAELRRIIGPGHLLPQDLLPEARSVVSFFLPFDYWIVKANARDRVKVADEWVTAYVETNDLIKGITDRLIESLAERGIRAAAEAPTHNFDKTRLVSWWSHKSVAVIAGLGSFGLHQMVITDSGCAGRFGSLVTDALLPFSQDEPRERCLYFDKGSCLACVRRCPANALDENNGLDRARCYQHLLSQIEEPGRPAWADVCGKCVIGPCAFKSAVR